MSVPVCFIENNILIFELFETPTTQLTYSVEIIVVFYATLPLLYNRHLYRNNNECIILFIILFLSIPIPFIHAI